MKIAESTAPLAARSRKRTLLLLLLAGAVLRIFISAGTAGHLYDSNTFFAWATQLAEVGPEGFYAPDYFGDYPPGYMLVLWGAGVLIRFFRLEAGSAAANILLSAVPIACDLAIAALLYRLAKEPLGERGAALLAGIMALHPTMIFDSAVWKQVDSVLTLALLLCFYAIMRHMYPTAAFFYALALLIKPQALLFGPVFALCYLLPIVFSENRKAFGKSVLNALLSLLTCLVVLAGVSLLFQGDQTPIVWLVEKYTTTTGSYPYATVNAFNLFALLGGNWVAQDELLWCLSWKQWGTLGILLVTLLLIWFALRAYRARSTRFSPFLLCGFYCCGIFTLGQNMHERYLIPGIVFLFAAFATLRDRRLLRVASVFSGTCLVNMVLVFVSIGGDEFLQSATSVLIVRLVSALQVLAFGYLLYVSYDILVCGRRAPVREFFHRRHAWTELCRTAVPRWTKFDTAVICALTLATAAVSLTYLGDATAPTKALETKGAAASSTVQFPSGCTIASLWAFPGIGNGTITVTDYKGSSLFSMEIAQGNCFSWCVSSGYALQVPAGTKFKLELSEGMTLNELAFKDKEGRLCTPVPLGGDAAALFDEQMLVPERPSQMNGMYFDEIYHGRTAFEMLHGLPVYETTHPPLGKDLILLGVALLGMNPLGWRIAGAVFGVAMVPVFYLLCRRLLKKRRWSAFATTLFALDFMRFTQSRIATIDVFVVFFILLATYFMLWSMQTMLRRGSKAALVPIALSGAAFGLACASKWTGLYAGAGLAVLYFSALYARWEILCAASGKEAAKPRFKKDFWIALCAGAAFFVLVPIALYLLSYLPYFLRKDEFFGLHELWECQKVMFRYHSTLTATHPFQSAWYSWPFIGRPVWYYMGTMLPAGTAASIAVLGNPVVWWGGLCGMVALALQAVRGRQTAEGSVVLISFAAQLLPWVFVSRAVFLYHYFACVPFIVLALTLTLMRLTAHHPVAARRLRIALPLVAAALFIFFYPVLAGVPISQVYAQALRLLPSWGFYIL